MSCILADSSQQIALASRVLSTRQRSRSGESSPVGLSQNDVTYLNPAVTAIVTGNALPALIRSSSDSSILMLPEKGKVKHFAIHGYM
jgi:hypothetical protein